MLNNNASPKENTTQTNNTRELVQQKTTSDAPTPSKLIQGVGKNNNTPPSSHHKYNTTQKVRVLSIKYKIYCAVILVIMVLLYDSIIHSRNQYQSVQAQLTQADQIIAQNIAKSQQYDQDISLVQTIQNYTEEIVNCINRQQNCETLPSSLQGQINIIRNYLQLNSLASPKMPIDEKVILKNINEFLAQSDPFDNSPAYNGEITKIRIGETQKVKENLQQFDLHMGMVFENQNSLLQFINNIENHVFYEKNEDRPLAYSLMYHIVSIDYDIVNYNQEQEITMDLQGFYYVD